MVVYVFYVFCMSQSLRYFYERFFLLMFASPVFSSQLHRHAACSTWKTIFRDVDYVNQNAFNATATADPHQFL